MTDNTFKFYQDEVVDFSIAHHIGIGRILGIATQEMPVIGSMWIIQVIHSSTIPSADYPFNTIVVPENSIRKADKPVPSDEID